ncbi:MAG: RNA ligase, DRB0094 family [Candidatus Gottesmanbacteria bacterium GW2011_GWB1_49_7]|uniref:RNA ligase, DRB0094 family n=1 Tax=Candidatus Gottesmanbacteria bacterium GW2011_GWB1_49_7 TaxID=1618448 RepID=A0A0G1Y8H5_9BACT|nr:MAG: RNA ligase, DRB0094 family [Candidatus Gottesmanbacteria bacterium GW2011_GWB1_49_7]
MPSELIIEVCEIIEIRPHPGANKLDLCTIKGWQTCTPKGCYQTGDKVVFFPPDTLIPVKLAERLGVASYLKQLPQRSNDDKYQGRVVAIRLRGEASYGFVARPDDLSWPIGTDVADYYGVGKWIPTPKVINGDAETPHPNFYVYTNIESYGNFPNVFQEEEGVIVTEKLHGTNCRMGLIHEDGSWIPMAGSHHIRRKPIDKQSRTSSYWIFFDDKVRAALGAVGNAHSAAHSVIIYGEIVGPGIQDMHYGLTKPALYVFDISVDGKYLDKPKVIAVCTSHKFNMAPVIYTGAFHKNFIQEWTSGPTLICRPEDTKKGFKGREGCVIAPLKEHLSPELNFRRTIIKSKSVDFEARKNAKDEGE